MITLDRQWNALLSSSYSAMIFLMLFVSVIRSTVVSAADPIATTFFPASVINVNIDETVTFEVLVTHEEEIIGIDWYVGGDSPDSSRINSPDSASNIVIHETGPETGHVLSATISRTYQIDELPRREVRAQPIARELVDDGNNGFEEQTVYGDSAVWDININVDNTPTGKPRYMHIGDADVIIGDPVLEQYLFAFSKEYNISGYILYNVNQLLVYGSDATAEALDRFIAQAKDEHGINEVGFAVDIDDQVDAVVEFVNSYPSHIDFFQSEFEFWNGNNAGTRFTYDAYIELLDYMKNAGSSTEPNIAVTTYLGHLTDDQEIDQVNAILDRVSRVLLSCYVHDTRENDENYNDDDAYLAADNAEYTYSRCQERLSWFGSNTYGPNESGVEVEVWPIISAEYRENCYCTGPWLRHNGIAAAENVFEREFGLDSGADAWRDNINIEGYVYYSFAFLSQFIIPESTIITPTAEAGATGDLILNAGDGETVVLNVKLANVSVDAQLLELTIGSSGEINEETDVGQVHLYHDVNQDGIAVNEERIATNSYDEDNGEITFTLSELLLMPVGDSYFLVSYEL